jgi:hypothetical protein
MAQGQAMIRSATFEIRREGEWVYIVVDGKVLVRLTIGQWSQALISGRVVDISGYS